MPISLRSSMTSRDARDLNKRRHTLQAWAFHNTPYIVKSNHLESSAMVAPVDGPSPAPRTGFDAGRGNTALQSHVAFFDQDNDGVIWPSDTWVKGYQCQPFTPRLTPWPFYRYSGFRDLKFNIVFAFVAMCLIHGAFSWDNLSRKFCLGVSDGIPSAIFFLRYVTWGSVVPDPCFRLKIKHMHRVSSYMLLWNNSPLHQLWHPRTGKARLRYGGLHHNWWLRRW